MPYYDLKCEACQEEHNIKASVQERVSGEMRCPSCESDRLVTIYKRVNILKYHGKDCDVCPGASAGPAVGCGGSCGFASSWR